jgi:outer membrane protein assembly factor BamB
MARISSLLALLTCAMMVSAADWPQWQGPARDGHSADTGLLEKWPDGGPKVLWSITDAKGIGAGYGTPAVVGDRLYIVGATGAKQGATELVTCLALSDGKRIWQKNLPSTPGRYTDGWGGGPRSTPTVEGGKVYVLGVTGDLVCLNAETGAVVWAKNLVKDFGGAIPGWGYAESPLIDGDRVVCTPGSRGGMVALNKATGALIWQCKELRDPAGYSSIMVADVDGIKVYVQQTMGSALGVRARDGKLMWKGEKMGRRTAVIPSPVVDGKYAFFTAGYGAGCECFKMEKDGDAVKANVVYTENKTMQNKHGGVVRVGDYVYGCSDRGGWMCIDLKKGGDTPVWQNRGIGMGSVSYADGYLYCYTESNGTLARVKATPKGYEEAGKLKIPQTSNVRPGRGKVWAHPVIANGKLILRDYELLFVYNVANQ